MSQNMCPSTGETYNPVQILLKKTGEQIDHHYDPVALQIICEPVVGLTALHILL